LTIFSIFSSKGKQATSFLRGALRTVLGQPNWPSLAQFLPIFVRMGPSITCAEALVEILNLCEQTLTALRRRPVQLGLNPSADKYRRIRRHRDANIGHRLVLLHGGLGKPAPASRKPI
jgi:hypothetical protein